MTTLSSTQQGLQQVYGAQGTPIPGVFQPPVIATRDPTTTDYNFKVGRQWVNKTTPSVWFLGSKSGGSANWIAAGSGAVGGILSVTGDDSVVISPSIAGNINLNGTANQITTTSETNGEVFSIPSTFIAPGSIASTTTVTSGTSMVATTTLTAGTGITSTTGNIAATAGAVNAGTSMTATLGNITATNGNLVLGTAGNKVSIATGSNASAGTSASLSGSPGTITVSTTAVTASSLIFLSRNTTGGTLGELSAPSASISAGVHFVINSSGNETSTVNWWIVN